MSNLTCISKKIFRIVMGVIVFLCFGFVLNNYAYAIDIENFKTTSKDDGSLEVSMKWVGGDNACLGANSYGNTVKYRCESTFVSYVDYYPIEVTNKQYGGICKDTYNERYKSISSKFVFTPKDFEKFSIGNVINCSAMLNVTYASWGSTGWKMQDEDGSFDIKSHKVTIKHSEPIANLNYSNNWKDGSFTFIKEYTNPGYGAEKVSWKLPTTSDVSAVGYTLKGFVVGDSCKNTGEIQKPGVQVDTYPGNITITACWDKDLNKVKTVKISNLNGTTLKGSTWTSDTRTTTASTIGLPYDTSFKYSDGSDAKGKVLGYATSVANCDNKNYVITMDKVKSGVKVSIGEGTTTFYACWEKNTGSSSCYVTFHGEGGNLSGKSLEMFTCPSCNCSNVDFSTINGFKKTGYKLKGWSESTDCKTLVTTDFKKLKATDKRTFYACWESVGATNSFNLTFDGNKGKISSGSNKGKTSINVVCSGNCKNANFTDISLFTRSGFQFTGWSENKNCSNPQMSVGRDKVSAATFYACWTPVVSSVKEETFTLTLSQSWGTGLNCPSDYKTSGTNGGLCIKSVIGGKTYALPSVNAYNAYDNNYKFIGWTRDYTATTTNCSTNAIKFPGEKIAVYKNTLMYACYREDINGVMYAMDGASADGQDVPCGSALNITNCVVSQDNVRYCFYDKIGTKAVSGKVYRDKMSTSSTVASCNNTQSQEKPETNVTTINGYRYGTISAIRDVEFECGAKLYITTCNDTVCNFTSYVTLDGKTKNVSGTVNREYLKLDQATALKDTKNCPKVDVEDDKLKLKSCNNVIQKNVKGTMTVSICYDKSFEDYDVKKMILDTKLVSCGYGYEYDETATRASGNSLCNDKLCVRNYVVTCAQKDLESNVAINTIPAIAGANGKGIVKVQAYSTKARIVAYYVSEILSAPTATSEWISINSSKFEIESTPGVKYIWVKDSYGAISNVSSISVIDKNNSNNTLKNLQLSDGNNNIVPNGVSYITSNSNYAFLSNSISEKTLISKGFDQFTSEYKIDVDGPTLSVYATKTSDDASFVPGYGPRNVNLKYGTNTILIKIQDKEGKIRTYTIIANRTDDRSSDNTLNDISLSVGKIDFNSNVTEYKIEIPKSTTQVNVDSVISSELSSYVEGYEPGVVVITGDTTVKLIKVESQTGSTRTYVLSFVKENTDVITKESLQLSGLTIPGVYVPFESSVANYNISVDYTAEVIDLYAALKDQYSDIFISVKKNSETTYKSVSGNGISLDVGDNYVEIKVVDNYGEEAYYRLTIIRKEYGLDISNDTTLKDLKVLGYNIKFSPNKKEYSVKIKSEKSLVITAVPNSSRAEVFIRGNNELTGFSTVRVKVVAENGEFETYSVDIKKDAFNKTIEIAALIAGCVIILVSSGIIIKKKKLKNNKDYYRE